MLPWALFPFKVLPSNLNAHSKSSGAIPPKRYCSKLAPPERVRSELACTGVQAGHKRLMSIPAVVQRLLPPATGLAPKRQVPPACRPDGQPALEFFGRPLVHFQSSLYRLRRSPVSHFLVLQRPFQVEVALISRVFRPLDRNPSTDCISPSASARTSSDSGEVVRCARPRRFVRIRVPRHLQRVLHRWWWTSDVKRGFLRQSYASRA